MDMELSMFQVEGKEFIFNNTKLANNFIKFDI